MQKKPILYTNADCPRCRQALAFFDSQGVDLDVHDVSTSDKDMDSMVYCSGQTNTPTFEYEDFIVADFSIDEFLVELDNFPEIRQKLGISTQ